MPVGGGASASFPLTPALCVGERECPIPSRDKTGMVVLRRWNGDVPYEFHTHSIQVPYKCSDSSLVIRKPPACEVRRQSAAATALWLPDYKGGITAFVWNLY